ncbi:MAG: hypothetical protein AABZ63_07605 [Actinomycetota bacterium]
MPTPVPYSFTDAAGTVFNRTATLSDGTGGKPIVVLLHGLAGDSTDWTAPEGWRLHYNTSAPLPPDTVIGTFNYPALGYFGVPPMTDPLLPSITNFDQFLNANGFQTVVYSQIDPRGTLARPALELATVMRALHSLPGLTERRFVLLCHSRGGLLARKFLKDNKDDPSAVGRITKVITMHSPHHGSRWGNEVTAPGQPTVTMAAAFDAALNAIVPGTGPVVTRLLGPLIAYTTTPAYLEMRVDGPFITDLAAGETPLPGVEYHTFGGTSVLFSRLIDRVYTVSSAILVPGGFTHVVTSVQNPLISPVFTAYPPVNGSAETTPGLGDFLVSDASSRLPFENSHHTNPVNHAEVMWDPTVHQQVLDILRTTDVWAAWTVHRGGSFDTGGLLRLVSDEFDRLLLFAGGSFNLKWRRELAAGDPVPAGTAAVSPGEAPGWSDWTDFGQGGGFNLAADFDNLQGVGGNAPSSRLHVFAMDTPSEAPDDAGNSFLPAAYNVWVRLRGTQAGNWSSWMDIGGTVYGPSDLIPELIAVYSTLGRGLAVARNNRGEIELFATGNDDKLWTAHEVAQGPPGRFSAWSKLPIPSHGPVTAILDEDGAVLVFVYKANHAIACYRRTPDNSVWQEWVLPDQPDLALSLAVHDADNKIVLLARSSDGTMCWTRQRVAQATRVPDRYRLSARVGFFATLVSAIRLLVSLFGESGPSRIDNRWYPWTKEDGAVASGLSAERNSDGSLAVVARGANGQVFHRVQSDPLGDWTSWQELGGDISGTPVIGRLADGKLAALALSTEGHIRQRTQINPGQW